MRRSEVSGIVTVKMTKKKNKTITFEPHLLSQHGPEVHKLCENMKTLKLDMLIKMHYDQRLQLNHKMDIV